MASKSYVEYVTTQTKRNPCLENLCGFLAQDLLAKQPCRILKLEFTNSTRCPTLDSLDLEGLKCFLTQSNDTHDLKNDGKKTPGNILIVEDLTRNVVELLGSKLDIDPIFFATHIHNPHFTIHSSSPSRVALPSRSRKQNFLNLHYHQVLKFGKDAAGFSRLLGDGNVPRKVMMLPPLQNTYIGLSQSCCSLLMTKMKHNQWLGIVLVDRPVENTFRSSEKQMVLNTELFQGGFEDFFERRSFFDDTANGPERRSHLEDLVYYWRQELPSWFDPVDPSLLALCHYPLQIVAAEWVKYIEILNCSFRHNEYSSQVTIGQQGLIDFDSDLRALQAWARRCMQTLRKLHFVIDFICTRLQTPQDEATYKPIIDDYRYLATTIETYHNQLQSKVPLVASLVQIIDARRSLKEAANIKRMTNLALVFVPLPFVTGLLSINDGINGYTIGLFFGIAVPICVMLWVLAKWPETRVADWLGRLRDRKGDHGEMSISL